MTTWICLNRPKSKPFDPCADQASSFLDPVWLVERGPGEDAGGRVGVLASQRGRGDPIYSLKFSGIPHESCVVVCAYHSWLTVGLSPHASMKG